MARAKAGGVVAEAAPPASGNLGSPGGEGAAQLAPEAAIPGVTGRRVWDRVLHDERAAAGESGLARVWDEFLDGAQACYWGLTYEEQLQARRLCSSKGIGDDLQPVEKLNEELLPVASVILSARAGDTEEYAFDPATRSARTLLKWDDGDRRLLTQAMGGTRLQLLAQMIEQLSVVSMPRIAEHLLFFQLVTRFTSACASSLIPSTIALLNSSSAPEARALMREWESMRTDLQGLSDSAATLLRGSSTVGTLSRNGNRAASDSS